MKAVFLLLFLLSITCSLSSNIDVSKQHLQSQKEKKAKTFIPNADQKHLDIHMIGKQIRGIKKNRNFANIQKKKAHTHDVN